MAQKSSSQRKDSIHSVFGSFLSTATGQRTVETLGTRWCRPGGPSIQTSLSNDSASGALTRRTQSVTPFGGLRRCLRAVDVEGE